MNVLNKISVAAAFGLLSFTVVGSAVAQVKKDQPQETPAVPEAEVGAETGTYDGVHKLPWFSHPTVRQQLELNDDHYKQLNQNYSQAWNRYDQGLKRDASKLEEQERVKRQEELHGDFHQEISKSSNRVITDPRVRRRYNELYWQQRGYGAFNDPTIQQQLNLTDEQRQNFRQSERDWNQRMDGWNRSYVSDPDRTIKSFNEGRAEVQEGLRTTLTPAQQAKWNNVTGKPYEFPPEVYFQNGVVSKPFSR